MTECNNSKIHISSNFLLSICLLIMLDTSLLVPSLHCKTSLHVTTLHQTTNTKHGVFISAERQKLVSAHVPSH